MLKHEHKNNSTIKMDSNIFLQEENDKRHQCDCGDGSNLIDESKNKETEYSRRKIKVEICCSKNNKLFETVMEKTINFKNRIKNKKH